jgi:hypothetical protein
MRLLAFICAFLATSPALAGNRGYAAPVAPCTVLALDTTDTTRANQVQTFTSAAAVSSWFGSGSPMASMASNWFATTGACSNPLFKVVRFPVTAARAHLYRGNLAATISSLSGGSGTFTVRSQGYTWTSLTDTLVTTGSESAILNNNAANLQNAINGTNNANLPTIATFTGALTPTTCQFTGYLVYISLNVTANGTCAGGPPLGSQVCDGKISGGNCTGAGRQITDAEALILSVGFANNNTTQNAANTPNVETYELFDRQNTPATLETITAYWEVLTVGTLTSGAIGPGQQVEDGGNVSNNTCVIWSNISGSGNGSTWLVACVDPTVAQATEAMTTSPCSIVVINSLPTSGASGHAYEEISGNNYCPYYATTIGYLTDVAPGTVAAQLMLTQSTSLANGGIAATAGYIVTSAAAGMAYVQSLDPSFGYFALQYSVSPQNSSNYQGGPNMPYGVDPALQTWSQARPGQWPYYLEGYGGNLPSAASTPWAH